MPADPPNPDTAAPSPAATATAAPPAVPRAEAWLFWLKLGFVSFGGPAGQIALMHAELVNRRRWISERRFLHALNYCMLLPGPEAQQLATYLGWLMHRSAGGLVAGGLFVLPSLLILIALSWAYLAWGQQPLVVAVFGGIKAAVVAIVAQAAWRLGTRTLKTPMAWLLALGSFVALALAHVPFPVVVVAAAALGWAAGRWRPAWLGLGGAAGSGHAAPGHAAATGSAAAPGAAAAASPPLIDDDTPPPAHARFRPGRLAAVVAVAALAWAVPMLLLAAWGGRSGTLAAMAGFFTQAALVTFGGAYAVLPFVVQAAVQQYGWLSAAQMMDGLALGETTPGPLIMVVAFVGFVGGWQSADLATLLAGTPPWVAGALAASVATWFTFLPSFLFILAGGPLVEATRGRLGFTAPLAAISAAVVGVIVSLALFFARHVLWPQGPAGGLDALAAGLAAAALAALLSGRLGVMGVIGVCALTGGLRGLLAA